MPENACSPTIEFTYVPTYGSFEELQGRALCVEAAEHKIALYIYVSGWWTKPYWAWPLTPIGKDGHWTGGIVTSGTDQLATRIAAFLVPNGYDPPLMAGEPSLPPELLARAIAYAVTDRPAVFRVIEFSGYTWRVKASETRAGPGPNYFSDRPEDVWVDEDGQLHLTITHRDGKWYSTEVFTVESFGYGTYEFTLASRVDQLDGNVILGLFTWDEGAPDDSSREIDIEFTGGRGDTGGNGQFVVQPSHRAGNEHRFDMALRGDYSTHRFTWRSETVQFSSFEGHALSPGMDDEKGAWLYTGSDVPTPGSGNVRINLWLVNGKPSPGGQRVEVIVDAFRFVPPSE